MTDQSLLNIGMIGTGRVADRRLAPALRGVRGVRLWSVLSQDSGRAQDFAARHQAASPEPAHTELAKLLADPQLDAVIVATVDSLHEEQTVAAAKAGKHVLVEKPMATTVAGAQTMVAACREADVRLGVAYHLRFHDGHRRVAQLIGAGAIGEVRHARAQWTWRAPDASNWRATADASRWWGLAGVGTHCLDIVRWWMKPSCGEVTDVESLVTRNVFEGPHDETAIGLFRFESGATAEVVSSVLFESVPRIELWGTKGFVICEATVGPFGAGTIRTRKGPVAFKRVHPYAGELYDFADAIREGRDPEVSGEEGLRNVELLTQIDSA